MSNPAPIITASEATEAVKRHGSQSAAAQALGVGRTTIRRALARGGHAAKPKAQQSKGRSVAEFRSEYDKDTIIPNKIDAALETMDGWLYESEFVKLATVSYADLGMFRDKYADHIVFIRRDNKRVWCDSKAMAAKLREMI